MNSIPFFTWEDDIDHMVIKHGGMIALIAYQGDAFGRPLDEEVEEIALWLRSEQIDCYFYRPESEEGERVADSLMIPLAVGGTQIRQRLQRAVNKGRFSAPTCGILRARFAIAPSNTTDSEQAVDGNPH